MTRLLALPIVVLALAIPLAGCGDDDDDSSETGVTGTSDVERYCAITVELDAAGEEEFEALENDPNATEEDFEQAERDLVEDNEELFEELVEVAPEEIAEEIDALLRGLRARAGLSDEELSNRELNDAEKVINRYEDENCDEPAP